ncbi:hypothetical protein Kpol_505p22 [Vanderwaltozyma polyspora DSM 70294]|uniref:phosphatidylinositol-3,4,5-trisphosphate 3-phosphatase n=1 Tax=Vanderwaltozyma polyspora (strain ATCC 22028 / DSM 70294 / BCRC 21397 / CBS 2163 / NBRC 10782 / NRRL Y-8283 / UCD 57-17) TaxID=436907 RepID=A7TNB3_VANPO|nr:uncharacterized protein Kpol_505p22 [Vanderwaltozyma polyspora DSM 70294]EDO16245.1 hypothetical protein Kpol_505p22 [Vanderwaltozyma polyspora DSM 70294]
MTDNYSKFNLGNIIKKVRSLPLNVSKDLYGYNLDISQITSNIMVCSYPVTKYPKLIYRNSLGDLINYLNTNHGENRWKIYNLKVEMDDMDYTDADLLKYTNSYDYYDIFSEETCVNNSLRNDNNKQLQTNVPVINNLKLKDILLRRGWLDHCPPPFIVMQEIIEDIHFHLSRHKSNVAVIHCKMGKGRSGTIVIAYLMKYLENSLDQSKDIFMKGRFKLGISKGVTIWSQLRYLRYHEIFLKYDLDTQKRILRQLKNNIGNIRFHLQTIELVNPISFIQMQSHSCVAKVKVQTYKSGLSSLKTLASMSSEKQVIENNKEKITIVCPVILSNDITDIKIKIGIKIQEVEGGKYYCQKTSDLTNNLTNGMTFANFWFNIYWESIRGVKNDISSTFSMEQLKYQQSLGQEYEMQVHWDKFDGTKGTRHKGLKLFDSMNIKWKIK